MAPWMQASIPLGIVLFLSLIPVINRKIVQPFALSIHNGSHYLGYSFASLKNKRPLTGKGDMKRSFTREEFSDNKNLFVLSMGYIVPLMVSTIVLILAMDLYNANTALIAYFLLGYLTFVGFTATFQRSPLSYGFIAFGGVIVIGIGVVFASPLIGNLIALGLGFAIFLGSFNKLFLDALEDKRDFPRMAQYGSRRLLSALGTFSFAITPALLIIAFRLI